MASRGPYVSTSMDGLDHAYRQRIAAQYQASVLNKSRLKYCIFFHYFLSFAMLAKVAPYILDRFNWFILSIEELEVPEPYIWEWFWLVSFLPSIFCLDAIKKNSLTKMRYYVGGIIFFGYIPLFYAIGLWFFDVWTYLFSDDVFDRADVIYWKGLPYGLLWYAFILLALQVHSFSMYFSYKLMTAWKIRPIIKRD